MNKEDNICLHLIGRTWERDSSGLFDYSSKEITKYNSIIFNNTNIIREGKYIYQEIPESEKENKEDLFCIKKQDEKYIIENNVEFNMEQNEENISKINNKLWYVIHNGNKKYFLTKNDIIKLGRIKFLIEEVSIYSGDTQYELSIPNISKISKINKQNSILGNPFNLIKEVNSFIDIVNNNSEEKTLCKICYTEEIDKENNPMVHLCKCKGGLNYAHFDCIKQWMKTKLQIKENEKKTVKSYYIPSFNCEICKTPYPYKFKLLNKNKIYELIDIERPKCNYIILESLNQIKEKNENNKFIHVIKLINEEDITIGRNNMADIKINDISVSRIHAKIKFNFSQKSLEIKDLKSKFGTLVLIKDKVELKFSEGFFAQTGRTLLGIKVIKKEEAKINEDKYKNNINEEEAISDKEINNNGINDNIEDNLNKEKVMIENNNQNENSNDNNMEIY